jgi:hypothetical protein
MGQTVVRMCSTLPPSFEQSFITIRPAFDYSELTILDFIFNVLYFQYSYAGGKIRHAGLIRLSPDGRSLRRYVQQDLIISL